MTPDWSKLSGLLKRLVSLMNLVMVESEYLVKISLEVMQWLKKEFPLSRAVAGHYPKK